MRIPSRPTLIVVTGLLVLAISECNFGPGDETPVNYQMGFLPAELRRPPDQIPTGYVLHPPEWVRPQRDSLCFVIDHPEGTQSGMRLDLVIRKPGQENTAWEGTFAALPDTGGRIPLCRPAGDFGGRTYWRTQLDLEWILRQEDQPLGAGLSRRRMMVDPRFAQLQLQPFPVHFFPDRVGMRWLIQVSDNKGNLSTEVRRLASWDLLPKSESRHCYLDTVVRLRYSFLACEASVAPYDDLRRCAVALDSALAMGEANSKEEQICAESMNYTLDSASAANLGLVVEPMFGESRFTIRRWGHMPGGIDWDEYLVSGIGQYHSFDADGVSGTSYKSDILAVE